MSGTAPKTPPISLKVAQGYLPRRAEMIVHETGIRPIVKCSRCQSTRCKSTMFCKSCGKLQDDCTAEQQHHKAHDVISTGKDSQKSYDAYSLCNEKQIVRTASLRNANDETKLHKSSTEMYDSDEPCRQSLAEERHTLADVLQWDRLIKPSDLRYTHRPLEERERLWSSHQYYMKSSSNSTKTKYHQEYRFAVQIVQERFKARRTETERTNTSLEQLEKETSRSATSSSWEMLLVLKRLLVAV